MPGTTTISMRVTEEEAARLDHLARQVGLERSTLMRQALRRGCQAIVFEQACHAYRRGEVTLSRAAELADTSLREMVMRLSDSGIELNYAVSDLRRDLDG